MNHYTYELTCHNMKYIGVRSCECLPTEDTDYWGSSKYNPNDLREVGVKGVLAQFDTRLEAAQHEIDLHDLYDVGANPEYWNRAKSTTTGFDVSGTTHSDEAKAKIGAAHAGKVTSDKTKAKMSAAQTGELSHSFGKTLSEEAKAKLSADKIKPVNIHCRYTNNLIAENVGASPWAKANGYNHSHLCKTAKADRSKPSSRSNQHYHKGIYAQYV